MFLSIPPSLLGICSHETNQKKLWKWWEGFPEKRKKMQGEGKRDNLPSLTPNLPLLPSKVSNIGPNKGRSTPTVKKTPENVSATEMKGSLQQPPDRRMNTFPNRPGKV